MGLYLNPGNMAFRMVVRDDIYVDKTKLISYTNSKLDKAKRYICVSRPRRFGKSMAANMLASYYGQDCDSLGLFQPYKIAEDPSFKAHLNQYNVIFLNMQQMLSGAGNVSGFVSYIQETVIAELVERYPNLVKPGDGGLPNILEKLFRADKREKKGFVFIIDEWDCIFREVQDNVEVQKNYLDFLRDLFKDRVYVKLAYMTGILPIKKYGTHSALNIFYEYSMTNPKELAEFAGFTEQEVQGLCEQYHMDFEETKRWYDGYILKRIRHVYNPKSVVDAMLSAEFESFWVNTETYDALKIYIDMNFDGLKDAVIQMLGGVRCGINPRKFQNDMTTFTARDDVLTLLVHLGYLGFDEVNSEVFIPNEEVRMEFLNAIEGSGWNEVISAVEASEKLLQATLQKDEHAVAKAIDRVHMDTTSILNYNDENALSYVISLAYYSARKDYFLIRELPSGKGYADIVFLPRKRTEKPAMVIELKWDHSADAAISQIKRKQYTSALEEYRGNLLLVGINYQKETKEHQCIIEEWKK
ncbi:MAG: AAA family ATPase [Ruminococcus sp.]|nr:AAA family ATPase [Ruminococcus sp.]